MNTNGYSRFAAAVAALNKGLAELLRRYPREDRKVEIVRLVRRRDRSLIRGVPEPEVGVSTPEQEDRT